MSNVRKPTYYDCGICGGYHPALWNGDCRDDSQRFASDELDARHGSFGWDEIDMDDVDAFQTANQPQEGNK